MGSRNPKPIISRDVLQQLAETRFKEANALYKAGYFHGAIYTAGYAVECWLKVAICARLDWDELYDTFKEHDLNFLLLHSGLFRPMKEVLKVLSSFVQISGMWFWDRGTELRYCTPDLYGEDQAKDFLQWVSNETEGVVPWIRAQAS